MTTQTDGAGSPHPADATNPTADTPAGVVVSATRLELEHDEVPPEQHVDGRPTTGYAPVTTFAGHEVGVWEMTAGVMRDVEEDEVFVVVSGSATVEIEGHAHPITLAAGDILKLTAGMKTVWTVSETLRKVYIA